MSNQEVKIRKIWTNENSSKDQVTVQFVQKARGPLAVGKLAVIAQDLSSLGTGTVTALFSMKSDVCQRLFGTTDADYSNLEYDQMPSANPLAKELGEALTISVVENTTQNPANPNQQPKINPVTQEILMSGGKPIYRHTTLTPASEGVREWLAADKVEAGVAPAAKVNALDAFGVVESGG